MVGDKLPGTKEEQGMHSTAIELTSPLFRWVSCARGTPARRGIPAPPTCGNPGKDDRPRENQGVHFVSIPARV